MNKTITMKITTILIMLFFTQLSFGQSIMNMGFMNSTENIFPSSPNAAAFQKYGETKVSLYSGIPDISIPLYVIKQGEIEIPIEIKYFGGGIKVDEEASQVGLGWSMNIGGAFSQIVAGKDDFTYTGYANHDNDAMPWIPYTNGMSYLCVSGNGSTYPALLGMMYSYITRSTLDSTVGLLVKTDNVDCLNDPLGAYSNTRYFDYQPDLFQIKTLNDTYQAYINRYLFAVGTSTGIPSTYYYKTVGEKNIILSDISNGKKAQTPDGLVYFFQDKEQSYVIENQNRYLSNTWFVSKISDYRNNDINFTYLTSTDNIIGLDKTSQRLSYTKTEGYDNNSTANEALMYSGRTKPLDPIVFPRQSVYQSQTKYVQQITFANGKVVFTYSNRLDVVNAKKLDKIEVFAGTQLVRTFQFNYSYFISTDYIDPAFVSYNNLSSSQPISHRLKLESIADSSYERNYTFSYNMDYNLPSKVSTSVDFWGFYNGKANSTSLIPDLNKYQRGYVEKEVPYKGSLSNKNYVFSDRVADRRASLHSLANTIKKVTYPTGGSTEYEFEPNTFSNLPMESQINEYAYHFDGTQCTIMRGNSPQSSYVGFTPKYFSIKDATTDVVFEAIFNFWFYDAAPGAYTDFYAYIKNTTTNQIVATTYNTYNGIDSGSNQSINKIVSLPVGNYELGFNYIASNNTFLTYYWNLAHPGQTTTWDNSSPQGPPLYSYANIEFNDLKNRNENTLYDLSYGAGLRIKKIKVNYLQSAPKTITYEYDNSSTIGSQTTLSSNGKLMDAPKFRRQLYENAISPASFTTITYQYSGFGLTKEIHNTGAYARTSNQTSGNNPIIILSGQTSAGGTTTPDGTLIGYSKVTEIVNEGTEGYTESTFTNNVDFSINSPGTGYQYLENGKILSEKIFDAANNIKKEKNYAYKKINRSENAPGQIYGVINEGLNEFLFLKPASTSASESLILNLNVSESSSKDYFSFYPINMYHVELDSISTKECLPNNIITSKVEYAYNDRHQLIEEKTNTSHNGHFRSTTYEYPTAVAADPAIQLLNTNNRINEVVSMASFYDADKLYEERKIYVSDSTTNNILLPKYIYSAKFPNNFPNLPNLGQLEKKITYDLFDSHGKLIQYTPESGVSNTIIWGYDYSLPIAKIENATFSQVQSYVANLQNLSASDTEANLISALNNLRSLPVLKDALITTYTYRPLIGVSTITDTKGDKATYIYDNLGRLIKVTDRNGNILSENEYHYKN